MEKITKNRRKAILLLILAAAFWGYSFIFTSQLIKLGFTSDMIIMGRYYVGLIALVILSPLKVLKASKQDLKAGVIIGTFLLIAMYTQNMSLAYTSVSKSAFISSMTIVIVPFLGYFILKSKVTIKNVVGLTIAIIGTAFLSIDVNNFTSINFGDFLALVSAIALSLQVIAYKKLSTNTSAVGLSFFQMLTVSLGGTILFFINGQDAPQILNTNVIVSFIYLGVFASSICYIIIAWSARHVDEVTLTVITSSQSLFAVIFDVLIIGTILSGQVLVGIILMSFAVMYFALASDNGKIYLTKLLNKKDS